MSARRWRPGTATQEFDRKISGDRVLRALFEVMFDQENRLRALEGRPALTRKQAQAALRQRYVGG